MPSNPTENRSVINVYGRDEDWVISTADRINEFFRRKRTWRPIIHRSGAYDCFLFLFFITSIIWLIYKHPSDAFSNWINGQTLFFNVIFGFYVFLFSFFLARFLFQYFRWLFPAIEYYKKSRVGAYAHRVVAGAVVSAVLLGAAYDIVKSVVISLF
jgi:Na+/phosphate symporter